MGTGWLSILRLAALFLGTTSFLLLFDVRGPYVQAETSPERQSWPDNGAASSTWPFMNPGSRLDCPWKKTVGRAGVLGLLGTRAFQGCGLSAAQ